MNPPALPTRPWNTQIGNLWSFQASSTIGTKHEKLQIYPVIQRSHGIDGP
jgi:hypothetical protein